MKTRKKSISKTLKSKTAKKSTAKKTTKKVSVKRKKSTAKKAESIFSVASKIRKAGEDWQKAIQRAKEMR
jgi:hypothetical protein